MTSRSTAARARAGTIQPLSSMISPGAQTIRLGAVNYRLTSKYPEARRNARIANNNGRLGAGNLRLMASRSALPRVNGTPRSSPPAWSNRSKTRGTIGGGMVHAKYLSQRLVARAEEAVITG